MGRKFGIKEAEAAGKFAKNQEQRETVVAMLGLLGIPIVLKEQVAKITKKLTKKIAKTADNVCNLHEKSDRLLSKVDVLETKIMLDETEREKTEETSQDWEFYDEK
jgi:divalent metal cation (Fe/Co/Zn/Cd) transporter